jgi:hypothetical protein
VARGTTLIQHRSAGRDDALTAPISAGDRKRLIVELRIEDEELRKIAHRNFSSFFILPSQLFSPFGSEGNFGGNSRRRLTADDHHSLRVSTRVLASSQPYKVLNAED